MKNSVLFSVLMLATASAAMAKGDCRLKLTPTFQVSDFADVDTFKTAYDISKVLSDRKHGFDISNDADAPYSLEYTISADVSNKRDARVSFGFSYKTPTSLGSGGGTVNETARKEKNQVKLFYKVLNDLAAALPSCPNR